MKKVLKILLFTIFIFLNFSILRSQQLLKQISIDDNNRVFLFFRNYPIDYKSSLSDDKTKVILTLRNCTVSDTARMKQGRGKINDVYAQLKNNILTVFVSYNEQVGYTAVPLPFSRSVLIEVFRWDKLTAAEDHLRTGLLALEDGVLQVARNELFAASLQQDALSTFYLGLIFLQEGKINSALHYLRFAELNGVDIPDLYAAISQIYALKNQSDSSNKYASLFQAKTGLNYTPKIQITNIIENDTIFLEQVSHLVLNPKLQLDTAKTRTDTRELARKFQAVLTDTTKKEDEIPAIYKQILSYVGGVILGLILLVIYLYLRWRQKQMQAKTKSSQEKFVKKESKTKQPPKTSQLAAKLMAARAYSKPKESEKSLPKEPNQNKEETIKFEEKQKAIENIIQEIRSSQQESNDSISLPNPASEKPQPKKPVSAKFEMAINLIEEQRKIKQRNIDELGKTIEIEMSRLNEIARSLGIEKGSLETRNAIENIEKDPEKLKSFLEKFKKD